MRRADVRLVRAAYALVVAGVIGLAAAPAARAVDNLVSITVKVGYSGFVKTQQWMPVAIDVTNKAADVDGILEVSAPAVANGPPTGAAIYETRVSLPTGTTKHLKTYLVESWTTTSISVRILQNGRIVASTTSESPSPATALVGVLSDRPAALNNFEAQHPGGLRDNVVHLSLEDVGDSAILLRAFDLLVIDDFATDTLTAAQRGAITDYVQNGGALLLGTGASWRKTLAGVSPAILPMRIAGTTTLSSIGTLDRLSAVEVATGTLNPGALVWLSEGDAPLLAETLVGSGSVNLATFDWNQEPVASWSGTNTILRQLLVRTMFSSATPPSMATGKFGMINGSVTGRSMQLSQALGSLPALDLPSLVLIGLLILAYVLVVGPINYLALRALHRRALAWVTVPLIAVVASAGAFGTGVFTKGRSVQTNQVSIIHLQPGWDRAYEESYTGVVTPTRGDYEVKVAGLRTLIGPIVSLGNGYLVSSVGSSSTELVRISPDTNTIGLPGMTAFVLRGFATEGLVDAPHLIVTTKFAGGNLTGTIRNDSTTTFTDALVLAGDGFQKLPGLAPGATTSFDFTPKASSPYAGPPAYSTIYTNYLYRTELLRRHHGHHADGRSVDEAARRADRSHGQPDALDSRDRNSRSDDGWPDRAWPAAGRPGRQPIHRHRWHHSERNARCRVDAERNGDLCVQADARAGQASNFSQPGLDQSDAECRQTHSPWFVGFRANPPSRGLGLGQVGLGVNGLQGQWAQHPTPHSVGSIVE